MCVCAKTSVLHENNNPELQCQAESENFDWVT